MGQRVVVAPDQAVPLHRLLLTLHAGSRILPGQILWCSRRTSGSDLTSFLKRIEHHRCASLIVTIPWFHVRCIAHTACMKPQAASGSLPCYTTATVCTIAMGRIACAHFAPELGKQRPSGWGHGIVPLGARGICRERGGLGVRGLHVNLGDSCSQCEGAATLQSKTRGQHLFCNCSSSLRFSIVGLESLPVSLREQMVKFQLRGSSEHLPINVDYVLASGNEALLGTMSWMRVTRLQAPDVLSPVACALQVGMPHSVQCFCGLAGSGKSHSMAKAAAEQAIKPRKLSVGESTSTADIITCLSEAAAEHSTGPHVQLVISSYANFPWLDQILYHLLVEGALTDPHTGSVFTFLPGTRAVVQIEIPEAVSGEVEQEKRPSFAEMYPALADAKYGMLLHLPVLADLAGSSPEARSRLRVIEPESM